MATKNVLTLEELAKRTKRYKNMSNNNTNKPNLNLQYLENFKNINLWKDSHNSASDEGDDDEENDEDNDENDEENEGESTKNDDETEQTTDESKPVDNPKETSKPETSEKKHKTIIQNAEFNTGSIHYVDACTLWKFPPWLVDRLQCSKVIENAPTLPTQQIRYTLMDQLKATSTDLIMYATVRREFLRTIALIELNNVARLLEVSNVLEIDETLKSKFFESLQPCVSILEDENKSFSQSVVDLALIIDAIYVSISPSLYFREQHAYDYNNVYCSYLVPGSTMQFTEMCCGGIVDNTWFSLESKYKAMVMVTPHVFDDPKGIQRGILKEEKYRVEAYFDASLGRYTAFDQHFKSTISSSLRHKVSLEHLVFSFFSKSEHYVEEKNVFLMNGPETKGNLTFAKIYHCLVKTAVL